MSISDNIQRIKASLPAGVKLVAVSKTMPVASILEAYNAGQRLFGENRIQEMQEKKALLPADIEWHMIGHVQSNKIKFMASFVDMVHGCDSLKLLSEINKEAVKNSRVISCLLQVHIASETTKFGFDPDEIKAIVGSGELFSFPSIAIAGIMGMATHTDDQTQLRKEFSLLKELSDYCRHLRPEMTEISMGMSGDYPLAIECGSTMVRIGSSIFGGRKA